MKIAPITVIPWQQDFLSTLLTLILNRKDDLHSLSIIFPHTRPAQYFSQLLATHPRIPKPLILPQYHTVSGLFSSLHQAIQTKPLWNAGMLDRIGLLLDCVRAEAGENLLAPHPDAHYLQSAHHFFPWGIRLASLFEECLTQRTMPESFLYMESDVSPFAASLLERLSEIFQRYLNGMHKRDWTTAGLDAYTVATALTTDTDIPPRFFAERTIYIAGFHALTAAEDTLFQHLCKHYDAHVVIHADPALLSQTPPHWSCDIFSAWAKRWHTTFTPADQIPHPQQSPVIAYYQGFDLHSQLEQLEPVLTTTLQTIHHNKNDEECGCSPLSSQNAEAFTCPPHSAPITVVLPDTGLLMPVLHHLPQAECNISMGYPLARSPLFQLTEIIFRLQEHKRPHGYVRQDLIDLLRHPYVKMLLPALAPEQAETNTHVSDTPDDIDAHNQKNAQFFRKELHRLEQGIRDYGDTYIHLPTLLEAVYSQLMPEEMPPHSIQTLLMTILSVTVTGFEKLTTPKQLGQQLEQLCALLTDYGTHIWNRFPIDAECLYRVMQSIIPELTYCSLSHEQFPPTGLYGIARELITAERVPFEADPLVGLQVLGLLETRLLTFHHVLLIDATEDLLPGTPQGDPLLPDTLRPILNLPAAHTREQIVAYNFFRLINSAEHITIFWQENDSASGIQALKKKKSRFVEELIWAEEQRLGQLLTGSTPPLTVLQHTVTPITPGNLHIPLTDAVRARIAKYMQRPLSASLIDAYLQCPVRFFHERVLGLSTGEATSDDTLPLQIGTLLHSTLYDFYLPKIGALCPQPTETPAHMLEELLEILHSRPEYHALRQSLPADGFAMLESATRLRLADYLHNQQQTTIVALEASHTVSLRSHDMSYLVKGTLDRIDFRDEIFHILDYKTGRIPKTLQSFWENEWIWENIYSAQAGSQPDPALLPQIYKQLGSIQLPLYLYLFTQLHMSKGEFSQSFPYVQAAFIDLADNGKEQPFFSSSQSQEIREKIICQQLPILISFVIQNIQESPQYLPHTGVHCAWCTCKNACNVSHIPEKRML